MAAAYDGYDYPRYWDNRRYEHDSEVIAIESFFERIGKGKRIIDIGGGYGRLSREMVKHASEITLTDPSSQLLSKGKEYLVTSKKAKFVHSTVQNLPKKVSGKKYDVVALVRVMHHIENPSEAIEPVSKILAKDGYFILEFANKLHGKAIFKNILSGNLTFPLDIFPVDRRSKKNIKQKSINFLNHHPDIIEDTLNNYGFKLLDKRSVSNIRNELVKGLLPPTILMAIERIIQKPLAKINFGPSIFILAKKKH